MNNILRLWGLILASVLFSCENNDSKSVNIDIINADNNQVVETVANNSEFILPADMNINIDISFNNIEYDSIKFSWSNGKTRTETAAPYSACGDSNGNYFNCNISKNVSLTAQAYSKGASISDPVSINIILDSSQSPENPVLSKYGQHYLPHDPLTQDEKTSSKKLVFAHYFSQFPMSISNKGPGSGYYVAGYLDPLGEGGKWATKGGFLRQRPIQRAIIPKEAAKTFGSYDPRFWAYDDFKHEIKLASQIGIDGFAINVLSFNKSSYHWTRAVRLAKIASEERNLNFKILLMPDMNSLEASIIEEESNGNNDFFVDRIIELSQHDSLMKNDEGKILLAPYMGISTKGVKSGTWWLEQLIKLESKGYPAVLMPVFQGWEPKLEIWFEQMGNINFSKYIYGVSDWGDRAYNHTGKYGDEKYAFAGQLLATSDYVRLKYEIKWMGPVSPQDYRPKSPILFEAGNSRALRNAFQSAIDKNFDAVQLITWSDFSEHTEIVPSNRTGYAYYDLSSYYINWFKSGVEPEIKRDTMYSFFRINPITVSNNTIQTPLHPDSTQTIFTKWRESTTDTPPENKIELLAFLTAPARLEIILDRTYFKDISSKGMASFMVDMPPLNILSTQTIVPRFRIIRDGKVVSEMTSPWKIEARPIVQNLLYHGMSSRRFLESENPLSLSWPWRKGNSTNKPAMRFEEVSSPFQRRTNLYATRFTYDVCADGSGLGYSFIGTSGNSLELNTSLYFPIKSKNESRSENVEIMYSNGTNRSFGLVASSSNESSLVKLQLKNNDSIESEITSLKRSSWYDVKILVSSELTKNILVEIKNDQGSIVKTLNMAINLNEEIANYNRLHVECSDNNSTPLDLIIDNIHIK